MYNVYCACAHMRLHFADDLYEGLCIFAMIRLTQTVKQGTQYTW